MAANVRLRFRITSLETTLQMDVLVRTGVEALMRIKTAFPNWSDLVAPIIDEKEELENLRKKIEGILILMKENERMSTALLRHGKEDHTLITRATDLFVDLTTPDRPYYDTVQYGSWESFRNLLATVEREMSPSSMGFAEECLGLMEPEETIYAQKNIWR